MPSGATQTGYYHLDASHSDNASESMSGIHANSSNDKMIVPMASPLATMPQEILSKIFAHCSDTSTVYLPPGPDLYPWKLGHVCSHWREILWNSPEVWSYIDIQYTNPGPRITTYFRDIVKEILARTNGLIFLSVRHYEAPGVCEFILSSSHRFRGLVLPYITLNSLFMLLELPPGALVHLESLEVTLNGVVAGPPQISSRFGTLHHDLPSLRELHVGGYASSPPYLLYLPLSQLIDLSVTVRHTSIFDVHSILRGCSALLRAKFRISQAVVGLMSAPPAEIVLPALRTFIPTVSAAIDWEFLLAPLVLPSLDSLTTTGRPHPYFSSAVTALLSRSGSTLRHLSMHAHVETTPHPELAPLLVQTPSLLSFLSAYVAPPEAVRLVHSGLLPYLENASWVVEPDGLCALLDLLDEHAARPSVPANFRGRFRVTCHQGEGAANAWARYSGDYGRYRGMGVDVTMQGVESFDVQSTSEDYLDEDDRSS